MSNIVLDLLKKIGRMSPQLQPAVLSIIIAVIGVVLMVISGLTYKDHNVLMSVMSQDEDKQNASMAVERGAIIGGVFGFVVFIAAAGLAAANCTLVARVGGSRFSFDE